MKLHLTFFYQIHLALFIIINVHVWFVLRLNSPLRKKQRQKVEGCQKNGVAACRKCFPAERYVNWSDICMQEITNPWNRFILDKLSTNNSPSFNKNHMTTSRGILYWYHHVSTTSSFAGNIIMMICGFQFSVSFDHKISYPKRKRRMPSLQH